jgi:D-3-phosphoglycerate dehydrogenase
VIRILNVEPAGYAEEARAVLQGLGELVERPLGRAELLRALPAFDVLVVRLGHQVDRELLDAGPRLRAVVTATTGLDHVDLEHARRRGVAVLSLRGETAFLETVHATAEHTWALLLALLRRVPQASAAVRAGRWERDPFRGQELAGRRLGLLGLGRLGRRVARYGLAFDMRVAAHDPHATAWVDGVRRARDLGDLLTGADVLSIHVPLTAETRGLVGRAALAALPPGAVLVNTARGEVVDEAALVEALASGRLAGAALDVVAGERALAGGAASPLLDYARRHDHVLVTPHVGGATVESMARTEVFMAGKLAAFLGAGRPATAGATAAGPGSPA